jgi:predicted NBD/HSP70 family sugar kinase
MAVVDDGLLCNCGSRGCWETLVSQTAVLTRVRQAIREGRQSSLTTIGGRDPSLITIDNVLAAAMKGDPVAQPALQETGRCFGLGVANLVNIFNPEMVILGGILSRGGDIILPAIKEVLQERAFYGQYDKVEVMISTHGFDACVMGGIALVLNSVLNQASLAMQVEY